MALDESTDVTDLSQLLIFARIVDKNYNIEEVLLGCIPMYSTTKGTDIFDAVSACVNKYTTMDKLSGVCTDGATAMLGKKLGFVGQLKKMALMFPTCIAQFIKKLYVPKL